MVKKVLLVDDDREMLLSLKEGLQKYSDTFSVIVAGDGKIARQRLREENISLVVTDLKMPRMDGFTLLSHIIEDLPDIPVMIMTAFSTPQMEQMAKRGGAAAYIEKPFRIDNLARQIIAALRHEADGGSLHSVTSGMFLQLIEMEGKTCTIRLTDAASGKQGVLFFNEGELIDARSNGLRGERAAIEIFSWEIVNLSIQNTCNQAHRTIEKELQAIYLEALRLKDESDPPAKPQSQPSDSGRPLSPDWRSDADAIRGQLEKEFGKSCGLSDVYEDAGLNDLLSSYSEIGDLLGAGKLQVAYLDRGQALDAIVVPGPEAIVITVDPKCPRDKILYTFSG